MHKKLWNKDFILMLQGGAFSALGDILYSVAIGYWVYDQTGSSTLMGLMSAISMFMVMIVMPFSGSIVDRSNRKPIIVGMDVLRGVIMLTVGALANADRLDVPAVLIAAFLTSFCTVFFDPAVGTLMLDIIPREDLMRGQSVQNGVRTLLALVGKAFSGALVAWMGVPLVIVINGMSYLISAFTELFVTVPVKESTKNAVTAKRLLSDYHMAVLEILRNRFLRLFIPGALLLNLLFSGAGSLMLPFVLNKGLTVDTFGYLMSIQTMASLLGVTILSTAKFCGKTRYILMAGGFVSSYIFYLIGYMSSGFLVLASMMFIGTLANTLGNCVFNASLMLSLPEDKRGTLLGFISAATTGGAALSTMIYGLLCDVLPMEPVFVSGCVLSIVPMIYICSHKEVKNFISTQ